jgi:class 3 adenylate cyclase
VDIADWLQGLGLARYEVVFRDNAIDAETLSDLTETDLEKLGVLLGHRKRMLRAIQGLRAGPPPAAPAPEAAAERAERRQLTVMFCDLVGSTPLSARLDPEDLRRVIGAYHRCVAEIVEGFGGFVARYMGDGVLGYFGYPQAHDDDAERATRCGLALVERVPQLGQAEELHARVGIATGLVVVGGEVVEHDVAGDTPNLAARLQALADPDTVVVAASTRRLTGELFDYRDLGEIELKGIAGPVSAWQPLRPSAVASRFEALRGSALTPLVGRDEEIDLLLRRWARAKAGDGQVVLVSGEPGIGKSRLTAALAERLHSEPHTRLRHFCSPYHQDSALYPFIEQLGRASGFAGDDPPVAKLRKLEALLSGAAPAVHRRSAVAAGFGEPSAAQPQFAAQEGKNIGGADPAARRAGTSAAGNHGFRGRALDRPDLARAARPHCRVCAQPAGVADRIIPPRVSATVEWSAPGQHADAQSLGSARSHCSR